MIKDMDGDSFLAAKVEQFGVQRGFTKQINGSVSMGYAIVRESVSKERLLSLLDRVPFEFR
jgi:hypothetical protein